MTKQQDPNAHAGMPLFSARAGRSFLRERFARTGSYSFRQTDECRLFLRYRPGKLAAARGM